MHRPVALHPVPRPPRPPRRPLRRRWLLWFAPLLLLLLTSPAPPSAGDAALMAAVPTAAVLATPSLPAPFPPLPPGTAQSNTAIVVTRVLPPMPEAAPMAAAATVTTPPTPVLPTPAPPTLPPVATATAAPFPTAVATLPPLPTPMPPLPRRRPPPTAVVGQTPFIPILMYHYVRVVDPTRDRIGYGLSVSPQKFAAQMDWLYREGYTTLHMETVARCLSGLQTCPPRSVALTFDDGYEDAYRNALPVLQHYNFVATFYIVTDFVGYSGYMDWQQLRAMRDAGMEIGAHSHTHLDLTSLDPFRATEEIAGSGQRLARELQTPVNSFCYPGGQFNLAVQELVRQAGYRSAVTTQQLFDQRDLLALPRVRVEGAMSQQGFEATISP